MDPQRYDLLQHLFEKALALPPNRRAEFVAEQANGDRGLQSELMGILEEQERTDFLTNRHAKVGVYRLVHPIADGGMGTVWMARRDDDVFHKIVALKIISPSGVQGDFVDRFKQERQVLARLDHPNIVRIIDGGATEDGLPFYVMDYVDGVSIVKHCDQVRADVAGRIRVFLQVCDAVEYIHSLGIIHRDLKPGNILVTSHGSVKLIDFGIAKLAGPWSIAGPSTMIGTPDYASPEQKAGMQITDSTDIFSLGVILYQLLTGKHPLGLGDDVPPPSRNLDAAPGRRISSDLDRVVLTAMDPAPARRYPTVHDFAEDLRRVLEGRPVSVRHDRRFPLAGLVMSIIVLLVLVAGFFVWHTMRRGPLERHVAPLTEVVSNQPKSEMPGEAPVKTTDMQHPVATVSSVAKRETLLQDNFAMDSSLKMTLWSPDTPLLRTMASKASSPDSQWIAPVIRFHGFGMTMSGPAGAYQFTGVESRQNFSPPFTVQAKVMGLISNGEVFELYLTRSDLERHIAVAGNLSANSGYRGVWVSSFTEHFWDLGQGIYATPTINIWYLITIRVDASGNASAALADDSGATVGSHDVNGLGSGPFHLILAQREGLPYVVGPNAAIWGQVQVLNGSDAW